jgi:hypothetical protein
LLAALVVGGLLGCSTRPSKPVGPPPEYEPPVVPPWDSGVAQDLPDLDQALDEAAEGEWVSDYPQPDGGVSVQGDADTLQSEGGVSGRVDSDAGPPVDGWAAPDAGRVDAAAR